MSGKTIDIPLFLKGEQLPDSYFCEPDPYSMPPISSYNILEIARYSERTGKPASEFTKEEMCQFLVKQDSSR